MNRMEVEERLKSVQDYICNQLEGLDGKRQFVEDNWERQGGGGGRTRVLSDGAIIEKGGVNFSAVHGAVSEKMKNQLGLNGKSFFATGVSIVIHPQNPFHPIMHMNVRYFEMDNGTYWFGGGIDLTPHYLIPKLAQSFHQDIKTLYDQFHPEFYPRFKKGADDYFYIQHRNETRGVGGTFYDHITEKEGLSKERLLEFSEEQGKLFPKLYADQINYNRNPFFTDKNIEWRNLRRGRYVEFNLVYDRGTTFGLKTGGRIESILMSLPRDASWYYNFHPKKDSLEEKTLNGLKKGVDWIGN